ELLSTGSAFSPGSPGAPGCPGSPAAPFAPAAPSSPISTIVVASAAGPATSSSAPSTHPQVSQRNEDETVAIRSNSQMGGREPDLVLAQPFSSNASSFGADISARKRSKVQGQLMGTPRSSRYQLRQPLPQMVWRAASLRSASSCAVAASEGLISRHSPR